MKEIEKVIKKYYLSTAEIKNYNVMIDGRKLLDQTVKNSLGVFDNIRNIATGQGDKWMFTRLSLFRKIL